MSFPSELEIIYRMLLPISGDAPDDLVVNEEWGDPGNGSNIILYRDYSGTINGELVAIRAHTNPVQVGTAYTYGVVTLEEL